MTLRSSLTRPGQDGLTAAEANEKGRELAARNDFPARELRWDYMMPEHINAIDGTHEQLSLPGILSGSDAADFLRTVENSVPSGSSQCNCEERHSRWSDPPNIPPLREDGVCLGCGCYR